MTLHVELLPLLGRELEEIDVARLLDDAVHRQRHAVADGSGFHFVVRLLLVSPRQIAHADDVG